MQTFPSIDAEKQSVEFQIKTVENALLTLTDPKAKSVLIETKYDLVTRLKRLQEQFAQTYIKDACTRCISKSAVDGCALCEKCRKDLGLAR